MGNLRIASKKQLNASLTHLGKVIFHCCVVFEMLTKVPEIEERQDALNKLQAAHKVISRTVFATEIDWLNKSEAQLSSEEADLYEDRRIAELAAGELRVMSHHMNSWFAI